MVLAAVKFADAGDAVLLAHVEWLGRNAGQFVNVKPGNIACLIGNIHLIGIGKFFDAGGRAFNCRQQANLRIIQLVIANGDGGWRPFHSRCHDFNVGREIVGNYLNGIAVRRDDARHANVVANRYGYIIDAAGDKHLHAAGFVFQIEFSSRTARIKAVSVHRGHAFDADGAAGQRAGDSDGDGAAGHG